jgi:hypothetical protein
MTDYALVNRSRYLGARPTLIDKMVRLSNSQQYYHFAPDWGLTPSLITYYPDELRAPSYLPHIYLEDQPDVPGAGGYHDAGPGGLPVVKVFVTPYLDNGGSIMESPDSVLVALTHEMCETVVDPEAAEWVNMSDVRLVAKETADPVEDRAYLLRLVAGGPAGYVTDYVLPRWFEVTASGGKFDRVGALRSPFTKTRGGYWIVLDALGEASAEFGESFPEWKKTLKLGKGGRTHGRLSR